MAKGQLSIGDDTPTGEPEKGPPGPYITADDDGSEPAKPAPGWAPDRDRHPAGSRTETRIARESVIGSDNAGDAADRPADRPDRPADLRQRPKRPAQP